MAINLVTSPKYHDDNLTDADANAVAEQPYAKRQSTSQQQ